MSAVVVMVTRHRMAERPRRGTDVAFISTPLSSPGPDPVEGPDGRLPGPVEGRFLPDAAALGDFLQARLPRGFSRPRARR